MIIQSIAGLLGFAGIAWLMSENRKQVKLKRAAVGIVLQILVGLILLKIPFFRDFFLLLNRLVLSLEEATTAGKTILEIGRKMVFEEKTIVKGSCWDYIFEVYKRAGYATKKLTVFKSKKSGPYVDISKIQPGDWLYYVNHSYGGVEHSGIFIYWKDYKNKIGVTLSKFRPEWMINPKRICCNTL